MEKISYPKEIQRFFSEIVLEVSKVLDPSFIIIAGSFGKESWLYAEDKLISDFEFVFVCKNKWSLKKKRKLLVDLNKKFDYDISLKGYLLGNIKNKIISNYSKKPFGYLDLNFFDTFADSAILYSRNEENLEINLSCSEIPAWEAWRLYVNRMGDLLSLVIDKKSKIKDNYLWLKIFESTADAYLLINNRYYKNINERLNIFTLELLRKDKSLDSICVNSFQWIYKALYSRSKHNLKLFEINNLVIKERNNIITAWMTYFEKKVCKKEPNLDYSNFTQDYIKNKTLQKKYLVVKNSFAIQFSNVLKGFTSVKALRKLNFKFENITLSWRHLILLATRNAYMEQSNNLKEFVNTDKLLSILIRRKAINGLSNEKKILTVYKLWKELR